MFAGVLLAAAVAGAAPALDIAFCPPGGLYAYPAGEAAQTLLLHGVTIANRGGAQVEVLAVEVELLERETVRDTRRWEGEGLARAVEAAREAILQEARAAPGSPCGAPLFAGAVLAPGARLPPGQAMGLADEVFAFVGARERLRVRIEARSRTGERFGRETTIPIRGPSTTAYRLPLRGAWFVAAGPTLHSHHRRNVFEAFALDFVRLGPDGQTRAGQGRRLEDHHAYGAEVIAAAAGEVVSVVADEPEDPSALRRPGEAAGAYLARLRRAQDERLRRGGLRALLGNHVVVRHAPGEYGVYAHLQPGAGVRVGQALAAGEPLGRVGSSGNSGEPHLHFHVCDGPEPGACAAIPVRFEGLITPLATASRPLQTGDLVIGP